MPAVRHKTNFSEPLLSIQNLSVVVGFHRLFENLSFNLTPGESLHLQGANGTGKTTLLKTMSGLKKPTQGTIVIPKFVFLGVERALKPDLTSEENLLNWCRIHQGYRENIPVALNYFRLTPYKDWSIKTLSEGQKQSLHLCRLMLTKHPMWLLDEPLVNLDSTALQSLNDLMDEHLRDKGIVIFASHQPGLLASKTLSLERAPQ